MLVLPHTTRHLDGTSSAKLKVVKSGGLEVDGRDPYEIAHLLIAYAKKESQSISRHALWFTERKAEDNLSVTEASRLLKAAKTAGHEATIDEEFGVSKRGETFKNRYAGRIKIGPEWVKPTKARPAAPLSDAAKAFLKG